jgi:hypothetical protein
MDAGDLIGGAMMMDGAMSGNVGEMMLGGAMMSMF